MKSKTRKASLPKKLRTIGVQREEFDPHQRRPDAPSIFVHLCCGLTEELRPADSVSVSTDSVVVFYGETPMACYPRKDIFFCSMTDVSPCLS
jgi:hypothetical protein